jgi:PAS domain S-box-containing protein
VLLRELKTIIDSTADAAFAVDGAGLIVAWNTAAAALFGMPAGETIGKACGEILRGSDECGAVCSENCSIRQAVHSRRPISAFDMQAQTAQGMKWINVSVMTAEVNNTTTPYSIHIARAIDTPKKLEMLLRDFVVSETALPAEEIRSIISSTRSPASQVELTDREREVLRLLAKGVATAAIAERLGISRTTVNNHVQHILSKLNAHSRLEAIRRAEHAGLI